MCIFAGFSKEKSIPAEITTYEGMCLKIRRLRLSEEKQFDKEELSDFNGQSGKSAYIAFKDRVFDVTGSRLWPNGEHMMRHEAGRDLTDDFKNAPHNVDVLDRFPQVGTVKKDEPTVSDERKMPGILIWTFSHFPVLKRHPHPFLVHFPLALLVSSPIFTALFLITGTKSFEPASFYCLAGGLLFSLAAIPSGLLTWWANYSAHFLKQVVMKIILSPILFVTGLIVFVWRLKNPFILERVSGMSFFYLALLFLLAPLVLAIGWFGATITFPLHKDT
jgi:predicted heme/steroid binding protein/uncharacterized membrane protein